MNTSVLKMLSLLALISMIMLSIVNPVRADAEIDSYSKLSDQPVYLHLADKSIKSDSIYSPNVAYKMIGDIKTSDIVESPAIIVDYLSLQGSPEILKYANTLVDCGKMIFIEADGYLANTSMIKKLFNYKRDNGIVYETSPQALFERKNTFGFMVYLDHFNRLQIVRQEYAIINDQTDLANQTAQITIAESVDTDLINEPRSEQVYALTTNQKISALNEFISYNKTSNSSAETSISTELSPQGFDVGNNYEIILSTKTFYLTGTNTIVGSFTRKIFASRLHPESTVKVGTPLPVSYYPQTTKWAFQSIFTMSPRYATASSLNFEAVNSFTTYPTGSSNLTYKQVIMDYLPKADTSGSTEIEYSMGASGSKTEGEVTGGVSWTASFPDIDFVIDYSAGDSVATNIAEWAFAVFPGIFDRTQSSKSAIDLVTAVRVDNTGPKNIGVQLNVRAKWIIPTYPHSTIRDTGYYSSVWILPVR